MKNILEILAGLGFFFTGTDAIYNTIIDATNTPTSPYSMPAPNLELFRYFLMGIGLLLLIHVGHKAWKENSAN